jgi:hypothetical protein
VDQEIFILHSGSVFFASIGQLWGLLIALFVLRDALRVLH